MSTEIITALDDLVAMGHVEKELVPAIIKIVSDMQKRVQERLVDRKAWEALEAMRKYVPEELLKNSNLSSEDALMLGVAVLGARFSKTRIDFGD